MEQKRSLNCLRCGAAMRFSGREQLQLGKTGWVLGDLPNLLAGAMQLDIYACPDCGKVEFFQPEDSSDTLPQKECPSCGAVIDFDYGRCPRCKYEF